MVQAEVNPVIEDSTLTDFFAAVKDQVGEDVIYYADVFVRLLKELSELIFVDLID